jgi:hypothetical protein
MDLHDFGGMITNPDGTTYNAPQMPYSLLTLDNSGNIFGTTMLGGLYSGTFNIYGAPSGAIWEITSYGEFKDLHDFGGTVVNANGAPGPDGSLPSGGVVFDSYGNLYGVAGYGGPNQTSIQGIQAGGGMLWEITSTGLYKDLHDFGGTVTNADGTNGPDGINPIGNAIIDSAGNIYGMANGGGPNSAILLGSSTGAGMLWEITSSGTYKDLHDFGGTITNANGISGPDGVGPNDFTLDAAGNLYGVATFGGPNTSQGSYPISCGMLWEIESSGTYRDIHDFGGTFVNSDGTTEPDGYESYGVTLDTSGNLYGTLASGGSYSYAGGNSGMVWEISPSTVSTTSLTSSANPSSSGQPVTFTAAVTGATPTGTVQFIVDGVNECSPVKLVSGTAVYTTSSLSVGSHNITAAYSGDTSNLGSAAGSLQQIVNPFTVTSLSPASVPAYTAFTLTVNGTGFLPGAQVRWGSGSLLTTTFVSSTQLTASVPLTVNWYRSFYPNYTPIWVVNPDGVIAGWVSLFINAPPPAISSLSPASVPAGRSFTLTVNGSYFQNGARIRWGNSAILATSYNNPNQTQTLTAYVPASVNWFRSSYPNVQPITVVNADGLVSNSVNLVIAKPQPVVSAISPASVSAYSAFTLNVTGSGFVSGAQIRFGSTLLTTTYGSPSTLSAAVPITTNWYRSSYPNSYPISVVNPDGAVSNAATLTVAKPKPQIISLNPSSVPAYSAFRLTINGVNFTPGEEVQIGGATLGVNYISSSQLTVAVPLSVNWLRSSYPNSYPVTVIDADGTLSNRVALTVTAPQ